ncbi:rRNA maturation RNase YbeY [Phenylobacterium sp.]|uniref:rRNA maturation RNase YbeY n=1 Tax=Phenylobacterium sp. TaxID=1871053 RepID=UPI002B5CD424|nr:rRNA maturation RNase YbeY [Phenylobacterium sp.]HLZ77021.1 rRNA maturation RNase YbeY [Phenylobacterium sp.]
MIDIEIEDSAWTEALADAHALVLAAADVTLASEGAVGEGVSFLLTDDQSLRDLNRRFRQQDKPTNVLSFPAPQNPERFLGDVALAYGVCAREAAEQGKPLKNHLQHLVAHGVFHLLGYDHETGAQAEEMEGLERAVLAGLGIPDPYAAGEGENGRPRPIG